MKESIKLCSVKAEHTLESRESHDICSLNVNSKATENNQERECPRQSKKRRLNDEGPDIEYPIPFKSEISFSNACQSRIKVDDMGWAYEGVQRYCEVGFDPKAIIDLMESIPKELVEIMQQGCSSLKCLTEIDNARITVLLPSAPSEQETLLDRMHDRLWQCREDCGYFRIRWDPVTHRRSFAAVNNFCASLAGFHPEVRQL